MKFFVSLFLLLLLSLAVFSQQPAESPVFATTLDGKTIRASDLNGKVVVLNLWFINCPNCVDEINKLNAIVEEYKSNPEIVFLAPAPNTPKELNAFLKENPFKYQVIPNAAELILVKFGNKDKNGIMTTPFPMHIVFDQKGTQLMKMEGQKGVEGVRAELKKLFPAKQ